MWAELRYRLRALFRSRAMERELDDELRFHLDREADTRGAGRRPDEAARRARVTFGGLDQVKEDCRDARGIGTFDRLRQDLRYTWRMLVQQPAFTVAVVGTLGLGIGGATTMFAVVDGVLLKPLPYPDASRIIHIGRSFGGVRVSAASHADYEALRSRAHTLDRVAVARSGDRDLTGGSAPPERAAVAAVSASYFEILGARPVVGQLWSANGDRPGAEPLAVVTEALWRRRFGDRPFAPGATLVIDGEPHAVMGVLSRRFRAPDALGQRDVQVWQPLGRLKNVSPDPDDASFATIATVAGRLDFVAAQTELDAIGGAGHFWAAPLQQETVGDAASGLWLLFGAVGLLLLLACANVAHLFLMRATSRAREIAVRVAIGAGAGRIARQLATEALCFGLAGGALGAGLALAGTSLVRAWAPADLPRIEDLAVDVRVLAFAFGIATLSGLVFGIAPMRDARRSDVAGILRGASMSAVRHDVRRREALVIAQTAIAVVLLTGAALLARSAQLLARVDPGFDPRNVAWVDVTLTERAYPGPQPKILFFNELERRIANVPGVEAAALVQGRPLGGGNSVSTVAPEGQPPGEDKQAPRLPYHAVGPGYFRALRIPLVDGRDFSGDDGFASPRVAMVSRAFAKRFWPEARAVGKRFWMGRIAADAPLTEIIGVVEDVRQYDLAQEPVPVVYRPLAQVPRGAVALVARHDAASATSVIDGLRQAAWSLDSSLPLDRSGTMGSQVALSIREPRFRALALSAFAAIAALIASLGLYGALAWTVRARRRELCVRIALGAGGAGVRTLVIRRGMLLAGGGIALGLAGAAAATNVLRGLMFGISATDGPTFLLAGLSMALAALVACWLPARRAGLIDPASVLRE